MEQHEKGSVQLAIDTLLLDDKPGYHKPGDEIKLTPEQRLSCLEVVWEDLKESMGIDWDKV